MSRATQTIVIWFFVAMLTAVPGWTQEDLAKQLQNPGAGRKPIQTYLVEIGFNVLSDRAEQMEYADIPTSLQLPEDMVDRLREVAGRILYDSKQFQKLIRDLGGNIPSSEP